VPDHSGDLSQLRGQAGSSDYGSAIAVGDYCPHEDHVLLLRQGHIFRQKIPAFPNRQGLSGQGGLDDLESGLLQYPAIGRNSVSRLQVDQVSRNQLCSGNGAHFTVP